MRKVETKKPEVKLVGTDGNVYALLGRCRRALKQAGEGERAKEMMTRVFGSGSYDEALGIMLEYVDAY